jgi:hypothetical protein
MVSECGNAIVTDQTAFPNDVEYIRADLVEAAIKRALDAAADVSSPWGSCGCSQDIRALDPAQFIEEEKE